MNSIEQRRMENEDDSTLTSTSPTALDNIDDFHISDSELSHCDELKINSLDTGESLSLNEDSYMNEIPQGQESSKGLDDIIGDDEGKRMSSNEASLISRSIQDKHEGSEDLMDGKGSDSSSGQDLRKGWTVDLHQGLSKEESEAMVTHNKEEGRETSTGGTARPLRAFINRKAEQLSNNPSTATPLNKILQWKNNRTGSINNVMRGRNQSEDGTQMKTEQEKAVQKVISLDDLLEDFQKGKDKKEISEPVQRAEETTSPKESIPSSPRLRRQQQRKTKNSQEDSNDDVEKLVPIRPFDCYPDPSKRYSDEELYKEMTKPSETFEILHPDNMAVRNQEETEKLQTKMHGGEIGSLKVEVLGCCGLPKFERFSKPNAIAYLICGSIPFATDSILSSQSPMWPARSKRAAIFPIYHAYAQFHVGIFSATEKDNDGFCGRSVISIAELRSNVVYDVTLPLRKSALIYDERPQGMVRLRFSLEWCNGRAPTLSYLRPARDKLWSSMSNITGVGISDNNFSTIPCADSKTLRNVTLTMYGSDLPGKFSRKAFRASARETRLYRRHIPVSLSLNLP
jgi:hypothetical protein